ncbi:MAG: hypothetical protein KBS96_09050 [Lachnospiraceae bacterium]|nr:hypothetical protein [Candidatus Colinaster scatohippi]
MYTYTNFIRIKKIIRRIEAIVLAILIIATSFSYPVTAAETITEQEGTIEQESESERESLEPTESTEVENSESEESSEDESVTEEETATEQEESDTEEDTTLEAHSIEYSIQTEVAGYKIKLEAYDGVFPEGEDLSLSATQIEDQEILDEIDSQISNVCEGEFKQISFDIKVLNTAGEELQPDRSKYIDNEDITPIQLSIEFANDEIEGEVEVFHFADDLSSMECLVSTVSGDEVTVEPEHFSVFTIIESNDGSYYSGLTPPTGYRTYIEWMPNSTAGLRRLQKIYVYANEGEKISFGSSSFINLSKGEVEKSLADSFGYGVGSAYSNASIAVTLPYSPSAMQEGPGKDIYRIYGSSTDPTAVISQIENSKSYGDKNIYLFKKEEITNVNTSTNVSAQGTIYNWQQEALGAKNAENPGGYTPISFTAPVTGIYTFRFFGTQYTKVVAATKVKKTDQFLQKTNNYVGAWDITVTASEAPTKPITGRTYTDALIWTIGDNISGNEVILNESVYALTSDGFEYEIDFNGLDPFGFVFFTNKRGLLVSSDDHEDGHYRSLARSVKSKRNQLDDLIEMGVHLNSIPTTDKDESYFITFENADAELLQHYTGNAALADDESIGTNTNAYKDFNFKGLNSIEDGKGTEGYGGYFSFNYDKSLESTDKILPSTYEIIIDFTGNETLEKEYGYAKGTHNEVILSNTLVNGENKIFWNGKDEHGNVVIGDDSGINYSIVSFNVKAGEVHFPLLDVENNRYGIKVAMQNNISGIDKSKIYYDNSDSDEYGKNIGDREEKLTGASSDTGAMEFSNNAGDYCVIDIWADYNVATPIKNYAFILYGIDNEKAFFKAKTTWQYFYTTMDGKRHFDASEPLPKTSEVVLQYRIVDKNTVGIGGINKESSDWQVNDTGEGKDWQVYSGAVTVSLQKNDSEANEQTINLNPSSMVSFDNESGAGTYKSVTIQSYRMDDNEDSLTKGVYKKESSEGLCVFTGLPLHPINSGTPDVSKVYQYRVVDVSNTSSDFAYTTDELFDGNTAIDIQVETGIGHVTKDIYLEEILDYRFKGATEFNLEFDQLWNDSDMTSQWLGKHRPKAVRVAVLYGIPLYEDSDTSSEYDITTEKGYYGEDVDIVWRKIQRIDYLTLYENGAICTDSNGAVRKLSLVTTEDGSYAAYFPVWKYMANGDPYFYRIRPVAYSMDGETFTNIEYKDSNKIVPKLSLPEFYSEEDDEDDTTNKKYHVVFYDDDVEEEAGKPVLYPRAVKFTDIPEIGEIEVTKTDISNKPILGKTASYEITNKAGKNLVFTLDSEGKYTYEGLDGEEGLPLGVTKVINTSTLDSIVHAGGLPLDEYRIREVDAPEGYKLSSRAIEVATSDFLYDSSKLGGSKFYLCKKSQKDKKLSGPDSEPSLAIDPTTSSGDIDGNGTNAEAFKANADRLSESKDTTGKKLPKTGGLTGSLVAMILGFFMIGYGIYLTKPTKKKRNNRN